MWTESNLKSELYDNHEIFLPEVSSNTNAKWPVIVRFQILPDEWKSRFLVYPAWPGRGPCTSAPLDSVDFNHVRFVLLYQMLKGRPTIDGRPGESLEPLDFDALKAKLEDNFGEFENLSIMSCTMCFDQAWR